MKKPFLFTTVLLIILGNLPLHAREKPVGGKEKGDLSARIQVHWTYDSREEQIPQSEFLIKRARLRLKSRLTPRIESEFQIDGGKGEFKLLDAYFEYKAFPAFAVRFGQYKMPFSREELRSAFDLPLIDRGRTNDEFGDANYLGRDIGFSIKGKLLPRSLGLKYHIGIFNGNGIQPGDNDGAKQFAERIVFEPSKAFSMGFNATQQCDSTAYGIDFYFARKAFFFEGELLVEDLKLVQGMMGAYLISGFRSGPWEVGLKGEIFDPDKGRADDARTIIISQIGYYFLKGTRVRLNWVETLAGDGTAFYKIIVQSQVVWGP